MTDHLKGTLDLNTVEFGPLQPSRLDRKGNFWFWIPVNGWRNPKGWWPISPPLTGNQLERLRLIFSRKPDEITGSVELGKPNVSGLLNLAVGEAELAVAIQMWTKAF